MQHFQQKPRFFRNTMAFLVIALFAVMLFSGSLRGRVLGAGGAVAPKTLWANQCVDTMKFSRDTARAWGGKEAQLSALISNQIREIASLGATCVAIDTPYADEFVPFLSKWVAAARQQHLQVWFRGNVPDFEGWFDYPPLSSLAQHHEKIYAFVTSHPELFADGDIFTPSPESENALPQVWDSAENQDRLRNFLTQSYANCTNAFAQIKKDVACGFFSANGDVAHDLFTKDMVAKTGNVVVIDHYISTSSRMDRDITYLHDKYGSQVALGEFGAPIPDINGDMTEQQQAAFIEQLMHVFYLHHQQLSLVNYWVLSGGTTALLHDDGSEKLAASVVRKYYKPNTITGFVTNTAGSPVPSAVVTTSDGGWNQKPTTSGQYWLLIPATTVEVTISAPGYNSVTRQVQLNPAGPVTLDAVLTPQHPSFFYQVKAATFSVVEAATDFMSKKY